MSNPTPRDRAARGHALLVAERDRLAAELAAGHDVALVYQHGAVGVAAEVWRRRTELVPDDLAAYYAVAAEVVERLVRWAGDAPQPGARRGFAWAAELLEDEG